MKLTREKLRAIQEMAVSNTQRFSRKEILWSDRGEMTEGEWIAYCWLEAVQHILSSEVTLVSARSLPAYDLSLDIIDASSVYDD